MNDSMIGLTAQVITAIVGLLVTGIGTIGGFYVKRLSDKIKRRDLVNEVNRYVSWAEQANSFKLMSADDKRETVLERIEQYALENDISISKRELELMVERSIQSLRKLEKVGLRLMARKEEMKNVRPVAQ